MNNTLERHLAEVKHRVGVRDQNNEIVENQDDSTLRERRVQTFGQGNPDKTEHLSAITLRAIVEGHNVDYENTRLLQLGIRTMH